MIVMKGINRELWPALSRYSKK